MKPISIRFQAFGPYIEEQFIDFSELEKAGLFLICGETGAGKTTILDAMTYALYGKSSGGGRGDIESMRCNMAPKEVDTVIEYIFDAGGKRYQFLRTIKFGRSRLTTSQNSMVLKDGVFVPLHENPTATIIDGTGKVPGDAENIIGLSYEQFRQVIILPQGQFEKLLTSDSAEKEKILVSIFHAESWQQIAEEVFQKAKAEADAYKTVQEDIERRLADFSCQDIGQFDTLLAEKKQTLAEQAAGFITQEKQLLDIQEKIKAARALEEKFVQLETKKEELTAENEKTTSFEKEKEILHLAELADKIKPEIERSENADNKLKSRMEETKTIDISVKAAKEKSEKNAEELQHIEEQKGLVQEQKEESIRLEGLRPVYQELAELEPKLIQEKEKLDIQNEKFASISEQVEKEREKLLLLQGQLEQTNTKHQQYYHAYIENISGVLAGKLEENTPCPVCGSLTHPSKAKQPETMVTDDDLRQVEEEQSQKLKDIEMQRALTQETENTKNELQIIKEEAEASYTNSLLKSENLKARLADGILTMSALNKQIDNLKNAVQIYEEKSEKLLQRKAQCEATLWTNLEAKRRAQAEEKNAKAEWEKAEAELQKAKSKYSISQEFDVARAVLTTGEKEQKHNKIATFYAKKESLQKDIEELTVQVEGLKRPNLTELESMQQQLETEKNNLLQSQAVAGSEIERMEALQKALQKQLKNQEKEAERVHTNLAFAKQLRGDTGVGLQRYVLGVMLSAITTEANQLLENVHGGRYRLARTDQSAGSARKAGLELEVRDANANGESRSVRGLSGGEKFLVALSLSIGLSTVAQKRGMKLEAMFIDEGFGSLDQKSIGDALDVLAHIQKSNGLVGIISHVQLLKDNIPTHIEIKRGQGVGSHVSICP